MIHVDCSGIDQGETQVSPLFGLLRCNCQYENDDMDEHARLDELQPYIQDALDLIEFANGSASSKWGKIRAEMGIHIEIQVVL